MTPEFTMKRDRNGAFHYDKNPSSAGLCFTIGWHRLSDLLKGRDDFFLDRLREEEYVERFELNEDGITVFIGKYGDLSPSKLHGRN